VQGREILRDVRSHHPGVTGRKNANVVWRTNPTNRLGNIIRETDALTFVMGIERQIGPRGSVNTVYTRDAPANLKMSQTIGLIIATFLLRKR
jgi:hypothetical protein